MKNFTKTILLTVVVSILEFSSYTQVTYANQFPYRPLTASQSSSGVQVAEVDSPHDRDSTHEDGDREASDVRRVAVAKTHRKSHAMYQKNHYQKPTHARRHHTR